MKDLIAHNLQRSLNLEKKRNNTLHKEEYTLSGANMLHFTAALAALNKNIMNTIENYKSYIALCMMAEFIDKTIKAQQNTILFNRNEPTENIINDLRMINDAIDEKMKNPTFQKFFFHYYDEQMKSPTSQKFLLECIVKITHQISPSMC